MKPVEAAEQVLADLAEHAAVMTADDTMLSDLAAIVAALALVGGDGGAVKATADSVRRWVVAKNFAGQMRLARGD